MLSLDTGNDISIMTKTDQYCDELIGNHLYVNTAGFVEITSVQCIYCEDSSHQLIFGNFYLLQFLSIEIYEH